MRNAALLAWKEIRSYYGSPMAYVVSAAFLALTGQFFASGIAELLPEASLRDVFTPMTFALILWAPIVSMRLLAEEQKLGTLELLLTAPLRDWEIVFGKFCALVAMLMGIIAPTLVYVVLLYGHASPDGGPMLTGYLGLFLYGSAAAALGLFTSSLTGNQIVAGVTAAVALLFLTLASEASDLVSGLPSTLLAGVSLPAHYTAFVAGVIELRNVVYFVSFIALFLFLTTLSLESPAMAMNGRPTSGGGIMERLHGWSLLLAALGGIGALGGVLLVVWAPDLRPFAVPTLIAAGVLLAFAAVGSMGYLVGAVSGRRGRLSWVTLGSASAALAIVLALNVIASATNASWDFTATRQFEISPQAAQALAALPVDVDVTGFVVPTTEDGVRYQGTAEGYLRQFARHAGERLSYRFVDPEFEPATAREFGVVSAPALLFTSPATGLRASVGAGALSEQQLLTAVLTVTGTQRHAVYFLTDHGERSIDDLRSGGSGLGFARSRTPRGWIPCRIAVADGHRGDSGRRHIACDCRPHPIDPCCRRANDHPVAG